VRIESQNEIMDVKISCQQYSTIPYNVKNYFDLLRCGPNFHDIFWVWSSGKKITEIGLLTDNSI
jgi:hypothetical protein